jgi:ERCC4-type nuclease
MIVKIDIRETDLLQQINQQITNIPVFKSIIVKTEVLPIGDIIICDDNEEKLIIERKSVSDLLSSIKDGRYEEQSYRLNGLNHHNHNIIYLVEGDVNRINRFKSDNRIEKLTLYSAMFSLNYYKGFSVLRTFSIEETAFFIDDF